MDREPGKTGRWPNWALYVLAAPPEISRRPGHYRAPPANRFRLVKAFVA